MLLGSAELLVLLLPVATIWPNCGEAIFVIGSANSAWLNTLKASTRISSFKRSVIDVTFERVMSRLIREGPLIIPRAAVPYVNSAGSAMTSLVEGNSVADGIHWVGPGARVASIGH